MLQAVFRPELDQAADVCLETPDRLCLRLPRSPALGLHRRVVGVCKVLPAMEPASHGSSGRGALRAGWAGSRSGGRRLVSRLPGLAPLGRRGRRPFLRRSRPGPGRRCPATLLGCAIRDVRSGLGGTAVTYWPWRGGLSSERIERLEGMPEWKWSSKGDACLRAPVPRRVDPPIRSDPAQIRSAAKVWGTKQSREGERASSERKNDHSSEGSPQNRRCWSVAARPASI